MRTLTAGPRQLHQTPLTNSMEDMRRFIHYCLALSHTYRHTCYGCHH